MVRKGGAHLHVNEGEVESGRRVDADDFGAGNTRHLASDDGTAILQDGLDTVGFHLGDLVCGCA